MKINPFPPAALLFLGLSAKLAASPLTEAAAVQAQPDPSAPVIALLNVGTEPVIAANPMPLPPPGWTAVEVAGPFEGYVRNSELTKQLEVKVGTPIRLAPKIDAGVLTRTAAGDKTHITGLHGSWTQVSLEKTLVGYVRGPLTAPAPAAPMEPLDPAVSPPAAIATGSSSAQPGMAVSAADSDSSALPRFFEGRFVSTRRVFAPRRPYDWQVNDASGQRYAYLDISKLLLTDQIDNYAGRDVQVFGTVKALAGTQDLLIQVESLRLK